MFDYSAVTADSIGPELETTIEQADKTLDAMVAVEKPRTFANTMLPLEQIGALTSDASGRGIFLANASPDEEVRNAARAAEGRLSSWAVDLVMRRDLYEAVRAYAGTDDAASLEGEERRTLEHWQRDLRRAGHELSEEARQELKELNQRLVDLGIEFSKNIAEYQDALIVTPEDLDGLPEHYLATLEPGDEDGTYKVTMAYPHVIPFFENATRRDLREQLRFKFNSRAAETNPPILEEATRLRRRIAELFGLPSWQHRVLEERMAKDPKAVSDFYDDLIPPLTAKGLEEREVLESMLHDDGFEGPLRRWDYSFYDTKLKRTEYGVDQQEVAQYFELHNVVQGMLEVTAEVFGLVYRQVGNDWTWHPECQVFEIDDAATGEYISTFVMDLHPREGKFSHAAMWPLVAARDNEDGSRHPALSVVLANLARPTDDRPSLLLHDEVVTLFHEFGHVLHGCLSKARFTRFSGASTEWDFVEAPSQIMEHWCWKPEVLRRFAKHYETGEPIPEDLVSKLEAARRVNVAMFTLGQISYGLFDIGIHGPGELRDHQTVLEESNEVSLLPLQAGTFFPASFGHMFGYDAGYYGYLWADVFGDDMFSRFEESGYTNPEVGMRYRKEILEPNASADADVLLRNFLGREPNNGAFLKKLGISGTD